MMVALVLSWALACDNDWCDKFCRATGSASGVYEAKRKECFCGTFENLRPIHVRRPVVVEADNEPRDEPLDLDMDDAYISPK